MQQSTAPQNLLQTLLDPIQEETVVLQELATVARDTRDVKVLTNGEALAPMLEKQAALCSRIAALRTKRNSRLKNNSKSPGDILPFLLNIAPESDHQTIVNLFDQYVVAAEQSQAEVKINRVVFDATLAAVESALQEVAQSGSKPRTYNRSGKNSSDFTALYVSTST